MKISPLKFAFQLLLASCFFLTSPISAQPSGTVFAAQCIKFQEVLISKMITDGGKENKKSFRETVKKDADDIKLNPLDANTLIEQIKANLEILEGPEPATQGGPFGSGFGYTRFIGMNLDIGLCWSDYWAKRPHSFTTEARELQVA